MRFDIADALKSAGAIAAAQLQIDAVEGVDLPPEETLNLRGNFVPLGTLQKTEPTGEVHPFAAVFPMMSDEELGDLAEDIKANGLLNPIVVDDEGRLIDGRNRLAGCERAGVDPTYTSLNGQDPIAFILSANITRRHLSKGQQAMAVAKARLFLKNSVTASARQSGTDRSQLQYAVLVVDYAPDLADSVLLGALSLNDAYEEARRIKEGRETEEEKASREQAEVQQKFTRLQHECPELAVKVQEGDLTLVGALAEQEERERNEAARIRAISQNLNSALTCLDPYEMAPQTPARSFLAADPSLFAGTADFSAARARRAAAVLLAYAELKEAENG